MLGGRQATTGWSGRRWGCRQDWLLSSSGFRLNGEKKKRTKSRKNTRINQESVACSTRGESSGGVGEKIVYSALHSTGNSSFNKTCGRVNEMLTLLQLLQSLCGATETLCSTLQHSSLSEPTLNCYSYTYNDDSPLTGPCDFTSQSNRSREERRRRRKKKKKSHITTVVCSS